MKKGVRLRLVKNIHLEIIYTENLKERIFYISTKHWRVRYPALPILQRIKVLDLK